ADEFRVSRRKQRKAAAFRRLRQSRGNQAHPSERKRVMVFPGRAMMIGKTANTSGHAFGSTRRIGRFQVEPGNADMFAMMKLVRRKRKIFKPAEKVFIA